MRRRSRVRRLARRRENARALLAAFAMAAVFVAPPAAKRPPLDAPGDGAEPPAAASAARARVLRWAARAPGASACAVLVAPVMDEESLR